MDGIRGVNAFQNCLVVWASGDSSRLNLSPYWPRFFFEAAHSRETSSAPVAQAGNDWQFGFQEYEKYKYEFSDTDKRKSCMSSIIYKNHYP